MILRMEYLLQDMTVSKFQLTISILQPRFRGVIVNVMVQQQLQQL